MLTNNRTILQVSELNQKVSLLLTQSFPLLWIEGEISNLARPASGHLYFSLKDSKAQIRCALFKNRRHHLHLNPENGMKILLRGRVSLYQPRGDFQIIAEHIEVAGIGLLQQQFEALKDKLFKKGWFDPSLKQQLPRFPKRIGIIASPHSAALQDILNILKRRAPQIPVLIYPSEVQGQRAVFQLETAIRQANTNKRCDVLIIARGGGTLEDLAPFNTEQIAHALYQSSLPIVSGIGHEIDITITDFIADVRAATPSEAAELVSPDKQQLQHRVGQLKQRLIKALTGKIKHKKIKLLGLSKRLTQQKPSYRLQQQTQRFNALRLRLEQQIQHRYHQKQARLHSHQKHLQLKTLRQLVSLKQQQLTQQKEALKQSIQSKISTRQSQLRLQVTQLETISPLKTLERGYTLVSDEQKKTIIPSVKSLKKDQRIKTIFKDGEILSDIISISRKK